MTRHEYDHRYSDSARDCDLCIVWSCDKCGATREDAPGYSEGGEHIGCGGEWCESGESYLDMSEHASSRREPPCYEEYAGLTAESRCRPERVHASTRVVQLAAEIDRLRYLVVEKRVLVDSLALPDDEFLAQLDARRKELMSA